MKILVFVTGFNPGGAELFLLRNLIELQCKGFKVSVVGLKNGELYDSFKDAIGDVVCLHRLPIISVMNILFREYDIIQGWMYHGDICAAVIGKIRGIPWIASVRNGSFSQTEIVNRRLLFFIYKRILSTSAGVVSCSNAALIWHKEVLGFRYINPVTIYNGYDYSASEDIHEKIDIILVGRNHPQKNYKNGLDILTHILNRRSGLMVYIVGKDVPTLSVENNRIVLLDHTDKVRALIRSARVLVSFSDYGEAFPNVLMEAILEGTPFVSYDSGEAKIMSQYGGLIMKRGNEVEQIFKVLDEGLKVEKDAALRDFNVAKITQEYINYYYKCVE